MNFVGHAIAARWEDDDPRHGAGAMLPDLARMCGAATPSTHDAVVLAGVRCHHRVDAAFHDAPTFLDLMRRARVDLAARGVPRAARLAAAHVGVELLLDGAFVTAPELAPAFQWATSGAQRLAASTLTWPDATSEARFAQLCEHLPEIAAGYASATVVGERVVRILARRPRLDPGPAAAAIQAWAVDASPAVARASGQVLHELGHAIGART